MFDHSILAWLAIATIVTITPGPDSLLVFGHATRHGPRAGLAATAGITVGGIWYVLLCGFGFLSLLALSPALFVAAKFIGAAYLAWLGARLIYGAIWPSVTVSVAKTRFGAPFRQGLVATITNPKLAIFYLAVLPQFVGDDGHAAVKGMMLIALHYAITGTWLCVVAVGGARLGSAIRQSHAIRWIEAVLGTAFVGLAGRLMTTRV